MDYETKYKDANNKVAARFGTNVAKEIFSDLYESEDEKIRKALISFLKSPFVNENITDEKVAPWLAWLEKQGSAWSEEDEVKINRIVACLENLNVADNDILLKDIDWLKSLKERIGG